MESKNSSLNLMSGRLGVFGPRTQPKAEGDGIADEVTDAIEGLHNQRASLVHFGGTSQQARMIRDKRRSLDRALLYSYQAATIEKVSGAENSDNNGFTPIGEDKQKVIRALINPNKLKPDYDDKILSVHKEEGFKPGDIFEWKGTGTMWIIYLQDLTELAYFRGDIRKCSFVLRWQGEDEEVYETYAAVRGPVETKINYIQKNGISVDEPNHSLNMYLPKNEHTVSYFKRYARFYLTRFDDPEYDFKCWRVEATDDISTPGILEITAVEYFINESDDNVAEGIAGGLAIKAYPMNKPNVEILLEGETFIKPRKEYTYKYKGINNSVWSIDDKYPIEWSTNPEDTSEITLKWTSGYSGQFEITYGNFTKTIVVESLF